MTTTRTPGPGLRERKKAQTRRVIQDHALRLFLAHGYDSTTVEEIAAAAGVSHMTFFRYFPTKEAVVDSDDYDPMIVELVRRRPAEEPPLTALHRALREGLAALRFNSSPVPRLRWRTPESATAAYGPTPCGPATSP